MQSEFLFFGIFLVVVIFLLLVDLGLFSRRYHTVKFREALVWSALWILCALAFYVFLMFYGNLLHQVSTAEGVTALIEEYHHPISIAGLSDAAAVAEYNKNLSLEYLTGYVIEKSLSVDNVFVILLIFLSFRVDPKYYKRVLFWGILGAIIMRFIFIFLLSALIHEFYWILFLFGGFLILTGGKMMLDFIRKKKEEINVERHPVVRFASKYFSVYPRFAGHKFWLRENGKFYITPLFLVLLVIEFFDVVFAVDSVPAIFSVSHDPFIVFFSNIFAIIGLRSLFFLISSIIEKFHLLKLGLSLLLIFVGLKMLVPLVVEGYHIPTTTSLIVILSILGLSVLLSLVIKKR